jgi:hypothetical protein
MKTVKLLAWYVLCAGIGAAFRGWWGALLGILVGGWLRGLAKDSDASRLARANIPYPSRKFETDAWGGGRFPDISSAAGEWKPPEEIRLGDILDVLEKNGFEGFEAYEEIDGGGADFLDPEEQLQAASAIKRLIATANAKGFVRLDAGRVIHISSLETLKQVLEGGRCLKSW